MTADPPRRQTRAERRVEILEQMIEDKTRDMYMLNQDLLQANSDFASTQHLMPGALLVINADGLIARANRTTATLLGYEDYELNGTPVTGIWPSFDASGHAEELLRQEVEWCHVDGTRIPMLVSSTRQVFVNTRPRLVCVGVDLRDRHRDEIARRHAQKLEALGQLAAGVAHEINTPMQFISDNLHLIDRGTQVMREVFDAVYKVYQAALEGPIDPALLAEARRADTETRWQYFAPRLVRASERASDGVNRVSEIVGALKRFSHPRNDLGPVDVNQALVTALTVARPELRNVATVTTELSQVPPVMGHAGDLNQVFLNMLVNAAHAITDAGRGGLGTIEVRTRCQADDALIAITDNGCGIPEKIRARIFDPFFTTKEPGRGTGQGLSLAHAVIVERHHGAIWFETSGSGTTFFLRIPIAGPPPSPPGGA